MNIPSPILSLSSIKTFYGQIMALGGIDLEVHQGEIVALIGANGAGKSTLMMTIFGMPKPSEGKIFFEGKDITNLPTYEISRLGIAQSPEGRRIFQKMSVYENLQIGAQFLTGYSFEEELERIFSMFPKLKERISQRAGTLSGGEQQMLAIARAIISRPKLLLLDEPSLGLAPIISKQIFEIIKEINRLEKISILIVEQNAHYALKLANRGYVIANGKIILSGTGEELIANPQVRSAYLEGA